LLKILADFGAEEDDIFEILSEVKKLYDPRSVKVGDAIKIKYKIELSQKNLEEKKILEIFLNPLPEREIIVSKGADGKFFAKEIKKNLTKHIVKYSGSIKEGLFVDGTNSGISPTTMMNMINLYGYDVDFQRDIMEGDKFEMLVESFYADDGKKVKDGVVLFSSLSLKKRVIETYSHKVADKTEYFDSLGNSIRKSLLRTPINGARVSSKFGIRKHPILGYSRMHKGIDFAAPSGTPILAAGSGTITHRGIKGGYGNFVEIKHNQDYRTAYGHASSFTKKFKLGSKVKQGDIIAFVGSTGRSTGPHLHFEIVYKGSAINPAKVRAVSGIRLSGRELLRFKARKAEIDRLRKESPNQI
jgi:murein DD-endopeptidase MepM/ murein hydrolase activator NlpD